MPVGEKPLFTVPEPTLEMNLSGIRANGDHSQGEKESNKKQLRRRAGESHCYVSCWDWTSVHMG